MFLFLLTFVLRFVNPKVTLIKYSSSSPTYPGPKTWLWPHRWQISPPRGEVNQRLPPEFGCGEDGVACPQPHWTVVGRAWVYSSCQSDQHNHAGWLKTNVDWRMACHAHSSVWPAGDASIFWLSMVLPNAAQLPDWDVNKPLCCFFSLDKSTEK